MLKPVTLRQHLAAVAKLAKEHPELLDCPIVYGKDEEGNGFEYVYFTPCYGVYNERTKDFDNDRAVERTNREEKVTCIN